MDYRPPELRRLMHKALAVACGIGFLIGYGVVVIVARSCQ